MLAKEFYKEVWWPRCEERLREVTQESYNCCWKNHIEPAIGNMDLRDITPRYLDAWLKKERITASVWRVTKAFIRTAYKYEEIDRDPCDRCLNAPPRTRPNPPTLSYWQMQELMTGLEGTPIYTTICCSCYCGLRREESCALTWEDFEWHIDDGEISYVNITKGVQYVKGREITVNPKTRLSRRKLPLPHELVQRIYQYRGTGRLLGSLHVHQAAAKYRQLTRSLGLPYVPMSNLRTSWATYMVNSGAPISLISRYMGHADVETTVRWYTKPNENELNELTMVWSHPSKYKFNANRPDLMRAPSTRLQKTQPSKIVDIYEPVDVVKEIEEDIPVVVRTNKDEFVSSRKKKLETITNKAGNKEKKDIYDILDKILDLLE